MKRVFIAQHPAEAHFVKGLLEAEGIEAEVRGEALFGTRGEAPVTADTLPSVWVAEEPHLQEALTIVAAYERGEGPRDAPGRSWRCPRCAEELQSQFTACWRCGATRADSR